MAQFLYELKGGGLWEEEPDLERVVRRLKGKGGGGGEWQVALSCLTQGGSKKEKSPQKEKRGGKKNAIMPIAILSGRPQSKAHISPLSRFLSTKTGEEIAPHFLCPLDHLVTRLR